MKTEFTSTRKERLCGPKAIDTSNFWRNSWWLEDIWYLVQIQNQFPDCTQSISQGLMGRMGLYKARLCRGWGWCCSIFSLVTSLTAQILLIPPADSIRLGVSWGTRSESKMIVTKHRMKNRSCSKGAGTSNSMEAAASNRARWGNNQRSDNSVWKNSGTVQSCTASIKAGPRTRKNSQEPAPGTDGTSSFGWHKKATCRSY